MSVIGKVKGVQRTMTTVDKILITGTLGICTGVWVTLAYLVYQNGF